ncbi:M9 family metallopeptidase [uncultured Photobacterium sp.]|uniref:M9 family metallopeptidase n=1 Tax=uncultured Photobacterium sp. TaxID=173973 RepID=UPI0026382CC0|nr:M9 family metallopeptidase [uncultured Photobacterium sp.]
MHLKRNLILSLTISAALVGCDSESNVSDNGSAISSNNATNQSAVNIKIPEKIQAPISISAPTNKQQIQATGALMELDNCRHYNQFSELTGDALFNFVKGVSSRCINELSHRNDQIAATAFEAENMVDIATRARDIAASYDSASGDDLYNLFAFLRGGFYVEHTNEQLTYQDKQPHNAVLALLETYNHNPHVSEITPMQGNTMTEYFTLWDSSENYTQSIASITRYLNEFSPDHLAEWSHRRALTSAFTTLYRSSWDAGYTKAAEQHSALRDALLKIANSEYIYNSEYSYQATDALKEYSRFLEYQQYWKLSETLKNEINNGIVNFMSRFERYSQPWLKAAGTLDYYYPGQCTQFNICGWKDKLNEEVLSIDHYCSDTIKIRAQDMTQPELQQACNLLSDEESLFHKVLNTGNQPVDDDLNTNLEVNIFDSTNDYKNYAGTIFGISTNNGGMYLEGNPSKEGNQARFIAHEATWRDDILVWNLRHEYIHYLDGRFNMYGGFGHFKTDGDKSVWWSEGVAEYISHQNRYDEAIKIGRQRRYALSEIFNNNYSSGDERVYRWGYLAVRFLFENSPESVNQLMQFARKGDVKAWVNYIDSSIGTSLDNKWFEWLETVPSNDSSLGSVINNGSNSTPVTKQTVENSCQTQDPHSHGQIQKDESICISDGTSYYFFRVEDGVTRIDINSDHGEGNIDLFYNSRYWAQNNNYQQKSTEAGNTESMTIYNPTPGWHYLTSISEPTSKGSSLKIKLSK